MYVVTNALHWLWNALGALVLCLVFLAVFAIIIETVLILLYSGKER